MNSVPLTARFNPREAARLTAEMKRGGWTVSNFIRAAVREKITRIEVTEHVDEIGRRIVGEIKTQAATMAREGSEREAALVKVITAAIETGPGA